MVRIFILFISVILAGCTASFSNQKHSEESLPQKDFLIFEAPHGFSIEFFSGRTTASEIYAQSGGVVVNGSYFGLTDTGLPYPAGLWIDGGVQVYPLQTEDPNLSYAVFSSGDQIQIVPNADTKSLIASCLVMTGCSAFQAGPLVLSGNILQDFGQSWHAYGKHERTLLGKTKSGKTYVFIFSTPTTLPDVSHRILSTQLFNTDLLTLLNLDGGPSTAYFDGKNGFLQDTKLPIFIQLHSR